MKCNSRSHKCSVISNLDIFEMRNLFLLVVATFMSFSCNQSNKISRQSSNEKNTVQHSDSLVAKASDDHKDQSLSNIVSEDSIYKVFHGNDFSKMETRSVSAENGLIIRDSLGKRIGRFNFGDLVYILNYSKDTITVEDNGKTIKGRKAKVIVKFSNQKTKVNANRYDYTWYVKHQDIGYVFDGFLYENYHDHDEFSLYNYDYLSLGEKGDESKISLKEFLDIQKINSITPYALKFIKKPIKILPEAPQKKDGKIELNFRNGTKRILKDTMFRGEYDPKKSYTVFFHTDFSENYMVKEEMIFTPEYHTEISSITGDTLNRFSGYPHISPTKRYAVLVTYDTTECYHDTYFEVLKKDANNIYKRILGYAPKTWSFPFVQNDSSNMDDIFSIHWLSTNEFIINAVDYIDDCYAPSQLSKPYYLKFKIKI